MGVRGDKRRTVQRASRAAAMTGVRDTFLRTLRRSLAATKCSDPACCIGSSAKCSGAMMSSTNAVLRRRCEGGRPSGRSGRWLKFKNPNAPAVKREAEEDWGR